MRRILLFPLMASLFALCFAVLAIWLPAPARQSRAAETRDDEDRPAASELRVVPSKETRDDYESRKKRVDPIQTNGPIFVGWAKPQAALLFSGEMDGYLEPCGCTGLENQMGGLKRRHTLIKQLEAKGWSLAKFDLGGLTKRIGPQAEIKFRFALESLIELGYSAVGLGAHELQLTPDSLLFALVNLDPAANPVTSANVGIGGFDSGLTSPYRVVNVGNRRVGVASVLGASHHNALKNVGGIDVKDPTIALADVANQLSAENCDLQLLLVHGKPSEAAKLARQFPQFALVGTTGGAEDPPNALKKIEGSKAKMIEVGQKGKYVIVVGLYDDPQQPMRLQRVPLDHRFDDSPEMHQMMVRYQNELKLAGLEGLGLNAVAHPKGEFAGSEACADCHFEATEVFEASHHPHATESLIKISDPPRQYDPECLSCHATGWNPQEYFPYSSGFKGLTETPRLTGNGCENCHGPAAAHVAVEHGVKDANEAETEALRASLRLRIGENEGNKGDQRIGPVVDNCMRCHDIDNSPDFDFQEYWEREVKHVGKD